MSQRNSEILLAGVIIARSTSYIFSKLAMGSMTTFNLLAARFILAFILLACIFFKKLRHLSLGDIKAGVILGLTFTLVMTMELMGLKLTDTATTSFIENSAIAFVPILEMVLFKIKPDKKALIGVILALTGIGFLTLGSSGGIFRPGSLYLLLAALFYAVAIIETDAFSKKYDPLDIGIVQVGTIGIVTLILSLIFEQPRLPDTPAEWWMIIALAVVCSGFGFTLQPVAQKGTTAGHAGMMCALNPLSASILGALILHERFTVQKLIGAALILSCLLLNFITPKSKEKR